MFIALSLLLQGLSFSRQSEQARKHVEALVLSVCLCVSLSVCLPACLPACLPVYLSVCLCICLPACLPACLPVFLSLCLCLCLCLCLPACLPVCRSVCLSLCRMVSPELAFDRYTGSRFFFHARIRCVVMSLSPPSGHQPQRHTASGPTGRQTRAGRLNAEPPAAARNGSACRHMSALQLHAAHGA